MKTKKAAIVLLTAVFILAAGSISAHQFTSIGEGILHILGIGLSVDPEQQTAPVNMATAVNTGFLLPDVEFGPDVPGAPDDLLVVAELTGPGITVPKTISARPGEQLNIPPLPLEGTYVLDNIRLMSGDQVVLYAEPSMAFIDTIEKLLRDKAHTKICIYYHFEIEKPLRQMFLKRCDHFFSGQGMSELL